MTLNLESSSGGKVTLPTRGCGVLSASVCEMVEAPVDSEPAPSFGNTLSGWDGVRHSCEFTATACGERHAADTARPRAVPLDARANRGATYSDVEASRGSAPIPYSSKQSGSRATMKS